MPSAGEWSSLGWTSDTSPKLQNSEGVIHPTVHHPHYSYKTKSYVEKTTVNLQHFEHSSPVTFGTPVA